MDPEAYARPVAEVAAEQRVNLRTGLDLAGVEARRREFGWNEIPAEPGPTLARRLGAQLNNTLVLLLAAAAGVSAVVWAMERETVLPFEALAIATIVLLNAVLGLVQEGRAERALAALRAMAAPVVTVVRDGERRVIPGRELVPGDLMILSEGDAVTADGRLIEAVAMSTLEAALTGESVPVGKSAEAVAEGVALGDRRSMVYSGTAVSAGHGRAIVTGTGLGTELGRIAGMIRRTEEQRTPLQRDLDRTGRQLGGAVLVIAAVVVATLLWVGGVRDVRQVVRVLMFGVALAVAAAPEGLAAVVTVVLAIGVHRMARRGAITRKLPAVETLGAATVIATDKTGTLTRNEMTVRVVATAAGRTRVTGTGYAPLGELAGDAAAVAETRRALFAAAIANNAEIKERGGEWAAYGDPTEAALLAAAGKAGFDLAAERTRESETPFSSERKWMSVVSGGRVYLKGAPAAVVALCAMTESERAAAMANAEAMAGEALRTLAVAEGAPGGPLLFLGVIGMMDPPRAEAAAAVAKARAAGVRPVMITGDHPATAAAVARDVGLEETAVFARVTPEEKLRIVESLRRGGAVVAMTGDGVNDAPALKAADIGIAMGRTGTDVAKEAADLILTDDNFATIVAAIEEGRAVFDNIRKFLRYLLSSNMGEVFTVFLGVAGGGPLPLLATQILWINLVTDGAPALALGADPADPGLMRRPPRGAAEGVIDRRMWGDVLGIGAVMSAGTLAVFRMSAGGGEAYARTMAFTTLVLFQVWNSFNCRSDERSAFADLFGNRWLWGAAALAVVLQVGVTLVAPLQAAFGTVALAGRDWVLCAGVSLTVVAAAEAMKFWRRTRVA